MGEMLPRGDTERDPSNVTGRFNQVAKGVAAPSNPPVCDSNIKSSSDRSFDEQVRWQV